MTTSPEPSEQSEQEEAPMPKAQTKTATPAEATYRRDELLANARTAFGVSRETMAGALRLLNKDAATRAEITEAITTYRTREV